MWACLTCVALDDMKLLFVMISPFFSSNFCLIVSSGITGLRHGSIAAGILKVWARGGGDGLPSEKCETQIEGEVVLQIFVFDW